MSYNRLVEEREFFFLSFGNSRSEEEGLRSKFFKSKIENDTLLGFIQLRASFSRESRADLSNLAELQNK